MEPTPPDLYPAQEPRLFDSERAAKIFISTWVQGKVTAYRSYDHYGGCDEEDITVIPTPHRDKRDMEVVPIEIRFP